MKSMLKEGCIEYDHDVPVEWNDKNPPAIRKSIVSFL